MMAKGNELKSQIIKGIHASSRTTSPQSAFRNWCEAMALALQNACLLPGTPRWKANEEAYKSILKSVGNDTMLRFREMFELYQELLTVSPFHDWLGQIYMELGGDSNKGQFFTPYNISQACAQLVCDAPDGDEPITICEPSCGSGGMIIATLEAMDKKHINGANIMAANRNNEIKNYTKRNGEQVIELVSKQSAFDAAFDSSFDAKGNYIRNDVSAIYESVYIWDINGKCYSADDADLPAKKDIVAIDCAEWGTVWVSNRASDKVVDDINAGYEVQIQYAIEDDENEAEMEAEKAKQERKAELAKELAQKLAELVAD